MKYIGSYPSFPLIVTTDDDMYSILFQLLSLSSTKPAKKRELLTLNDLKETSLEHQYKCRPSCGSAKG